MVDLCATILPAAMPCVVVRGANRCQKLKEWLFSERGIMTEDGKRRVIEIIRVWVKIWGWDRRAGGGFAGWLCR